jgi:hypothetical protein
VLVEKNSQRPGQVRNDETKRHVGWQFTGVCFIGAYHSHLKCERKIIHGGAEGKNALRNDNNLPAHLFFDYSEDEDS